MPADSPRVSRAPCAGAKKDRDALAFALGDPPTTIVLGFASGTCHCERNDVAAEMPNLAANRHADSPVRNHRREPRRVRRAQYARARLRDRRAKPRRGGRHHRRPVRRRMVLRRGPRFAALIGRLSQPHRTRAARSRSLTTQHSVHAFEATPHELGDCDLACVANATAVPFRGFTSSSM